MTTDAIELTEVWYGWKTKLFMWITKISLMIALILFAATTISSAAGVARDYISRRAESAYVAGLAYLPKVQTVQIVQAEVAPIEQLLDEVSKEMKFDPTILRAMAMQESGGYSDANRVKDEPQLLEPRIKNGKTLPPAIVPPIEINGKYLNPVEKLMYASSHGVLQVIFGFHYKTCGLAPGEWYKLHDRIINIRCGAKVLKQFASKYKDKTQSERVWAALRDYNNSDEYANEVMARIAAMRKFNFGEGI